MAEIIENVEQVTSDVGFSVRDGSGLNDLGDYVCTICRNILSCVLGVAICGPDVPASASENIFWESGLMNGFGKPVIRIVPNKSSLSSDFVTQQALFFEDADWTERLRGLLANSISRDAYYVTVGEEAQDAGDYEKAQKYYQDAYLLSESSQHLARIAELRKAVSAARAFPPGYRKRLTQSLGVFEKQVSRRHPDASAPSSS